MSRAVLVVTHGRIGQELIRVTESIIQEKTGMEALSLEHDEPLDKVRKRVQELLQKNDELLLLTDMFGGTPSNVCLSYLEEDKVEIISGINLPMLLKLAQSPEHGTLKQTADFIRRYGQKNITLASEILKAAQGS